MSLRSIFVDFADVKLLNGRLYNELSEKIIGIQASFEQLKFHHSQLNSETDSVDTWQYCNLNSLSS